MITFSGQCRGGCVIIPSDHDKNLLSPAHSHSSQLIQMLGRLRDGEVCDWSEMLGRLCDFVQEHS